MRKAVVGAMVSMDGVMQAPGGPEEDPTGGFTNHTRPENSAAHPTTSTVTSVRCSDSIDLKPWRSS